MRNFATALAKNAAVRTTSSKEVYLYLLKNDLYNFNQRLISSLLGCRLSLVFIWHFQCSSSFITNDLDWSLILQLTVLIFFAFLATFGMLILYIL